MTTKKFEQVVHDQLDYCAKLLVKKGDEYNKGDEDRLMTFKRAALTMNCTPEQALAGMMVKHTMSIYQMIGSGNEYTQDKWEEKITDHINYLLLLKALIQEEKENG